MICDLGGRVGGGCGWLLLLLVVVAVRAVLFVVVGMRCGVVDLLYMRVLLERIVEIVLTGVRMLVSWLAFIGEGAVDGGAGGKLHVRVHWFVGRGWVFS